jgi:hypothetical protein
MIGATILLRIDDTTGRGALLLRTSLIGCCGTAVLVVALIALTGNDLTSSWRLLRGRRATTLP